MPIEHILPDDGVTHGPLINGKAVDKAHEHVLDASSKGAKIVIGGNKMKGNFYVGDAVQAGTWARLIRTLPS